MSTVRAADQVAVDGSRPESPASTAMTTTPRCERTTFHVSHDLADGSRCPGHEPDGLTPDEVRNHAAAARRELSTEARDAAAYAYSAGFSDAAEGRGYSNAWSKEAAL
jgi:hypothetical protein